jgi:hypothetical protein
MAFNKESALIPSGIGAFTVNIVTQNGVDPAEVTGHIEILGGDGNVMRTLHLGLIPHLTGGQISTIQTFMDNLRSKAINEIL